MEITKIAFFVNSEKITDKNLWFIFRREYFFNKIFIAYKFFETQVL